jgi:multidrug efflux system membrane fusion protein
MVQARMAEGAHLPVAAFDRTRTKRLDEGVFSTLDNQIDTQTGTVRAKARFATRPLRCFPKQFVNVQLLLRTMAGAVVVPVTALRHGTSGDFVYVVQEDRTVKVRAVTRGEATVDVIAVTSGLAVGERVVTEGGDRLKDGARIQLADDRRPAGLGCVGGAPRRARLGCSCRWARCVGCRSARRGQRVRRRRGAGIRGSRVGRVPAACVGRGRASRGQRTALTAAPDLQR